MAHHYFWKFWFCWEHRQSFVWTIWILFKPLNDHCLQQFWINLKKQFIKIFNNPISLRPLGDHYSDPFGYCWNNLMILFSIIYFHLNNRHIIALNNFNIVESIGNHFFRWFGFCSNHWKIQQFLINLKKPFITTFNSSDLVECIGWSLLWTIWILFEPRSF